MCLCMDLYSFIHIYIHCILCIYIYIYIYSILYFIYYTRGLILLNDQYSQIRVAKAARIVTSWWRVRGWYTVRACATQCALFSDALALALAFAFAFPFFAGEGAGFLPFAGEGGGFLPFAGEGGTWPLRGLKLIEYRNI